MLGVVVLLKMVVVLQFYVGYGVCYLCFFEFGVVEYWRCEWEELDVFVLSVEECVQVCMGVIDVFQFICCCVDEEFRFE